MQIEDLQPPSFRRGANVIPDVPSRIADGRLWILRGSATSPGLMAMGAVAAAMPMLMGLAMADHRPAMIICFAMAASVLGCLVLAQVRGWRDYLVADGTQGIMISTRMRGRVPLWLIRHEPGWSCRIVLVRRVRPILMYYRHHRLKPGETLEQPHGPATINEVLHEMLLSGQGSQAVQVVPGGESAASPRARGDTIPPLISLRHARPAQIARLREVAVRLAAFMGLGFMDESEQISEFERHLPQDSPGIEHVALPIPCENAPRWAGEREQAVSSDQARRG